MTNDEAKFILNAYRANGRDAADPAFAAALDQAKKDPAVAAWLAREQAHGVAIAAKLREITPPPALRDAILAGARASENSGSSRARWSAPRWLAVAAAVAVLAGGSIWLRFKPASAPGESLVAFAVEDVLHGQHVGARGAAAHGLEQIASSADFRLTAGLPVDFAALGATGCRALQVGGVSVFELCFARDGVEFHLYVAPAAAADRESAPLIARQDRLHSASWTNAGHRFVLVTAAGADAMRRLL
jgi:hypothetical protein